MKRSTSRDVLAATLIEILIAASVGLLALGALFSATIAIQRCSVAAEDFAAAKTDQARLSDFIALDLRRAMTVNANTAGRILTLQIPDYYDADGKARTPTITNYVANYGSSTLPVTVIYRKIGSSIYREENSGTPQEIAADVEDFQLTIEDLGKVVKTRITFAPRFQKKAGATARTATTVYNTVLLRNKRRDI